MNGHRFCWADLATIDDRRATEFYASLFGWSIGRHARHSGEYGVLEDDIGPFGSLYRLAGLQVAQGVPSHWLPYVATPDLSRTLVRARMLGAETIVPPQTFPGLARIAVLVDPTGALLGLWQSDEDNPVTQARHLSNRQPGEG